VFQYTNWSCVFPTRILYAFFQSTILATCSAHRRVLHFTVQTTLSDLKNNAFPY
jgi:hypothetical protein